jgi:hypothetical protein
MRNPVMRAVCRVAATIAGAFAFYQYSWIPEHDNHVQKTVQTRTQNALDTPGDRAIFAARDNIALLQTVADPRQLATDFHLLYAVNDRILGRNDDAVAHYTAALEADHRPEIYYERGLTLVEQGKLDAGTADIALAARFNSMYFEEVDKTMQDRITALNKSLPYNPPPP